MPILNAGHTVAEHKSATRTRILSAFAEVLAREGWDGASVRAVAAEAGLTRTVIYNYYADKTEMLLAWSTHEIERFLDLLADKLAGMDDPRKMLETVDTSGWVRMISKAGRTVCAVVCAAPETMPSTRSL